MPALTVDSIKKILDEKFENQEVIFQNKLSNLSHELKQEITSVIEDKLKSVNDHFTVVNDTLNRHDTDISKHEQQLQNYEARIVKLENDLDEQINRNMCNNLVFQGIGPTWL